MFLDDETAQSKLLEPIGTWDALGYLKSVYNDPMQPTHARMKAASIAIEYERPRLAVQATIDGRDFATLLDRARARVAKVQSMIVEENAVEAKVEEAKVEPEPIKPLLPIGPMDKRYRR